MKTVKTPKGTELPLVNLKGKDYLMVAHRIQWFNEVESNFSIETEFLLITDEQTIARATIKVLDKEGKVVKQASATKRETKKDFSDHSEKAETSAIGRAVALLGYGSQFALADLDEGDRLADSPVVDTKPALRVAAVPGKPDKVVSAPPKVTSFRKPPVKTEVAPSNGNATEGGWE